MKKNLLMGMVGLGALALCITGVKAETLDLENVSETGQSVVVGEVDVPVYSVDITWGDMTFDYKYNEATGEYYWKEKFECQKLTMDQEFSYEMGWLDLYADSTCSTSTLSMGTIEDAINNDVYYSGTFGSYIKIEDKSVNGYVVPKLNWTSESKYENVVGNFYKEGFECGLVEEDKFETLKNEDYLYTDSMCTTKNENENAEYLAGTFYGPAFPYEKIEYNTEFSSTLGGIGLNKIYSAYFNLTNRNKLTTMPTAGDKIGTVTISIDAK